MCFMLQLSKWRNCRKKLPHSFMSVLQKKKRDLKCISNISSKSVQRYIKLESWNVLFKFFKNYNQPSFCLGWLSHYFPYSGRLCGALFIASFAAVSREKGRDLTQSCDKKPYTHRSIQKATWEHKNATKNFDYTTILAHETGQTHRKSSSRSFVPGRRSSTGYSCALL